ncbi:MAG: MFS transporter, partial [Pseudooceanicola sp.]
ALVAFATRLPWLLFSIPVGVVVDRLDRRHLMIRADLLRGVLTCGIIAVILSQPTLPPQTSWPILVLSGMAFLLGSAEVIRDNAAQTVLPSIVAKSDLESANGQMWSVEQVMGSFVGPPLAGLLIAWSVSAPFALEGVAFFFAALCVWCIVIPPRIAPPRRKFSAEAAEGWNWLRANAVIFRLAVMLGVMNALSMMGVTLLVLVSQEIYGLGAGGHGILLTAGAAGGVAGGILGPKVIARLGATHSLWLALAIFPFPFLVIAITSSPWVAAPALFLEMIAALIWNITTVSYRQREIPDGLLGRVNSIYRFFGWGMMPFGALIGGWIVAVAEPWHGYEAALRLPYILATLGAGAMFLYGLVRLRIPVVN